MRNPEELSWKCILGYTLLNLPKFQNSFVRNYCWIFQRRFPNTWKVFGISMHNIRMGYGAKAANQNLVLETGISEIQILLFVFWVLRAEKSSEGIWGSDSSCLVLRINSGGPFLIQGGMGFSYTSKGSLVFCGKNLGTRPQPQRPTLLSNRFYSDHIRTAFPSLSTYSRASSLASGAQSLTIYSLSAIPALIVLTLPCISAPKLLPALCQHG